MEPVKVALVGLGWWGSKIAATLEGNPRIRIARAVEVNQDIATQFADRYKIPVSAALEDALADPAIEAVLLVTPHSFHEQQIAQTVAAGKHVFCEKPLALTRAGAEQAVARCQQAGLVLGMGHERRFEPPIAAILTAAENGSLGRLLQIEANFSHDKFLKLDRANWRLKPDQAPAGGMTATGIHLTDLAVKLMGPARDVLVTCEQRASDLPSGDTMSAYVRFAGGGTAYISATLATPFFSRFAVFGTEGWIDVRDRAHVEAPDGWVVTTGMKDQPITVEEVKPAEPVVTNFEAFARAVRGEAAYPITGAEMVANIALLEAIVRGARSQRLEAVQGEGREAA
ncbi:Gfo/Idh/MocA family oxidoreductase [Acidisoma cellulosilytica]|uniref:Gfo/Idh/MocA family oxidoreductase n=1 Tax=Acidisoma cellulosilyticum TaxID=2802395 RepID=A0A964E4I1_9PROT|nr:Gfo/Idh/MocA family oxidoreductase [Acidisoma cellulosilyticum]MCB8881491.1 Gfo/Idh/MocA family oxidoreductase [Acidisoma cellulosilyticum]